MDIIYGAGLAGLIAAQHFQKAILLEASSIDKINHKAVLRFRTSAVGDAVGIPFRKVRVHKGIWLDGQFVQPSIRLANLYSQKVIGRLADRSIWNLEPSDRFVAPADFIEQLIDRCEHRIQWNHPVTADEFMNTNVPRISTLPMSVVSRFLMDKTGIAPQFNYAGIKVKRWRIKDSDVFQTIYFPSHHNTIYRASITGDLLIAEYIDKDIGQHNEASQDSVIFEAFGLLCVPEPIESTSQRFGKIAPIDDVWRKRFMFELTTKLNVFSLGRFATWKNILLDDVLKDINVIKQLANQSHYSMALHSAGV